MKIASSALNVYFRSEFAFSNMGSIFVLAVFIRVADPDPDSVFLGHLDPDPVKPGSGSESLVHKQTPVYPDPEKMGLDPQHWFLCFQKLICVLRSFTEL